MRSMSNMEAADILENLYKRNLETAGETFTHDEMYALKAAVNAIRDLDNYQRMYENLIPNNGGKLLNYMEERGKKNGY